MKGVTLGDFLRARRTSMPGDGNPDAASGRRVLERRRAPGLRRADLASRIGVSPDYYAKLEQARRKVVPSESVMRALAEALELDDAATEHMYDLARLNASPGRQRAPATQRVGAGMFRMMESLNELPALLLGRRTDILAANRAAKLLFFDFDTVPARDRNALKLVLLDDRMRSRNRDWEAVAAGLVGMLRMDVGRHPNDPRTAELVDELGHKSDLFNYLWSTSHVARGIDRAKTIDHPTVGRIRLLVECMQTSEDRDLRLHVMIPASDASSQSAVRGLRELATAGR